MKKVTLIILAVIIFCAGIALAGQQKRIRSVDSYEYSGLNMNTRCGQYCEKQSDNVDRYFKEGWQLVSQRPITFPVWRPLAGTSAEGYCQCIGSEYILDDGNIR